MAGHGGGAWKVAYADFVTAMMAFFLVMWITGQSKAVRAGHRPILQRPLEDFGPSLGRLLRRLAAVAQQAGPNAGGRPQALRPLQHGTRAAHPGFQGEKR